MWENIALAIWYVFFISYFLLYYSLYSLHALYSSIVAVRLKDVHEIQYLHPFRPYSLCWEESRFSYKHDYRPNKFLVVFWFAFICSNVMLMLYLHAVFWDMGETVTFSNTLSVLLHYSCCYHSLHLHTIFLPTAECIKFTPLLWELKDTLAGLGKCAITKNLQYKMLLFLKYTEHHKLIRKKENTTRDFSFKHKPPRSFLLFSKRWHWKYLFPPVTSSYLGLGLLAAAQ